ncbi:methionine adenosyltransferase [Methylocystis rosea]|uniref:methionine adenosyltransferase n=1 Tax=Methylocystis TaxID=133 RepID=UPI0023B9D149|nr:methionine adenosyltransferase [Methylocystis rosea]
MGKLYNIAAGLNAQRLIEDVADIAEAQCLIVSQIDSPVDQPQAIEVSVRGSGRASELGNEITATVADELSRLESVTEELTRGALAVGRWPLRQDR